MSLTEMRFKLNNIHMCENTPYRQTGAMPLHYHQFVGLIVLCSGDVLLLVKSVVEFRVSAFDALSRVDAPQ